MLDAIQNTLSQIERRENVRILFAVESGSRAWGFASPDSDYDVRYIYLRSQADYLRIDPPRDTLNGPLDAVMDFAGWDLRKALSLLRKSNPSLMEWVGSPIVYRTTETWQEIAAQFSDFYSPSASLHHYLSTAVRTWKEHLQADQVKLKKYLYVLRPLLCCRWVEQFGTIPPVPFDELRRAVLPGEMEDAVRDLLRRKQAAVETETTGHILPLDEFIIAEIDRIDRALSRLLRETAPGYERLNAMFLRALEGER